MIQRLKVKYGDELEETALLSKLMAYCSKESHSCVEKAAMIGFVKLRILEPDENCSLRGETLRQVGFPISQKKIFCPPLFSFSREIFLFNPGHVLPLPRCNY